MKIYLAGPMTGIADFNYPAFRATAARLAEAGFEVISPVDNGHPVDAPWHIHMRADLPLLMQCDGLALMDGWQDSRGVKVERQAALGVGIWVMPVPAWLGVARAVRAAGLVEQPAMAPVRGFGSLVAGLGFVRGAA